MPSDSQKATLMSFDTKDVKDAAEGRWIEICSVLAPQLGPAMEKIGRHVPCPVHGGQDGFRLFKDFEKSGGGICNTCGARPDGLGLIGWVNGWSFGATVTAVGRYLGLQETRADPVYYPPSARGAGGRSGLMGFWPRVPKVDEAAPAAKPERTFRRYGRVMDAGFAPYQFRRNAQPSAYVTLETGVKKKNGELMQLTFWGKDLDRAYRASGAVKGDWVELMRLGSEDVKTPTGVHKRALWCVRKVAPPRFVSDEDAAQGREEALENARLSARIDEGWRNAGGILLNTPEAGAVRAYLSRRAIMPVDSVFDGDALRAEKNVPIYDGDELLGRFPTMTAAVRDVEGRLVTLHRTFLTDDGFKADVRSPKRIAALPSDRTILGASVQLGMPQQVLGVAEGIETALSVLCGYNLPCWAALSAVGLEHFEPPEQVRALIIMADKDRSGTGRHAAEKLKARMAEIGVAAYIFEPPLEIPENAKGVDWNDLIVQKGKAGMPPLF